MKENAIQEVIELHELFEAWFNGRIPQTSFERLENALHPTFAIVLPDGQLRERSDLLAMLQAGYQGQPGMRVWVENPQFRPVDEGVGLVVYEEWQVVNEETTKRISTAVLQHHPSAPNQVTWLHVHETWF